MYPDTNIIKTRVVGFPFGFNSGDSTEQSTDTLVYALNGKWEVGERLTLNADVSVQNSEFDTQFLAVRTERVPEGITLDFNHNDGIPSWHFTSATGADQDSLMLAPGVWNMGQIFENVGRDLGDAQTITLDGDYKLGGDESIFQHAELRRALRQPWHDAQPARHDSRTVPPGAAHARATCRKACAGRTKGSLTATPTCPRAGWWSTATTSWTMPMKCARCMACRREVRPWFARMKWRNAPSPRMPRSICSSATKLQAQVGVRYSKVNTPMEFTDLVSPTLEENSTSSEVDDLMPSVTLRYNITDDFRLRLNYGETLRRPAFADLNPNFTLVQDLTNVGYGSGTGGNPDLEATKGQEHRLHGRVVFLA